MSVQRQQHALFTEAEYYFMEGYSLTRNEFFQDEIFAMAGTTPKHNKIAGNVYMSLRGQLRSNPCEAQISDQRLRVEANGLITYPDISVVCPPFRFDPDNKITLLDASVIVEVPSDPTRKYDQGKKFDLLRELPSLRHYLLIEPDETRVEHRFQTESGDWQTEVLSSLDDVANLSAIACTLKVRDVYDEI